jgi:hypothetical protein
MKRVGNAKIGKLSAKGIEYPQLRLPKQYLNSVGKIAEIYETEDDGKRAFLVVTKGKVSNDDMVLKPDDEVLKPQPYLGYDERLSALESKIDELKTACSPRRKRAATNKRPRARFEPASWPPQDGISNLSPKIGLIAQKSSSAEHTITHTAAQQDFADHCQATHDTLATLVL